ncbi:MAG: prephenate dehydratase [Epsilonproteobacteria bacterium]|nr:prephenate dehydratase [Campylobacterota bacterium]
MKKIREEINRIDKDIVEFLDKRAKLVKKISEVKRKERSPIFAPEREKVVFNRVMQFSEGSFPQESLKFIFREIISASILLEGALKVAYLGPEATFSQEAAISRFGLSAKYFPQNDIEQVFSSVQSGRSDIGVIPIENSNEGIINDSLDIFLKTKSKIVSEIVLKVHHHLLSQEKSISEIKKIYSHPYALAQCKKWIKNNLNVETIDVASTAKAAKLASGEPQSAAIASITAADIYHLNLLAPNIENMSDNATRFLVIGNFDAKPSGSDKTSILFSTRNRIGLLYDALSIFSRWGIDLTRIISRPNKNDPWSYIFYIDCYGHINDENIKRAMGELEMQSTIFKHLGSYPAQRLENNK